MNAIYSCKRMAGVLLTAVFLLSTVAYSVEAASDASLLFTDERPTPVCEDEIDDKIADHSAVQCFKQTGKVCGQMHRMKYDLSADDVYYTAVYGADEEHLLVGYLPSRTEPLLSSSNEPIAYELARNQYQLPDGQEYAICDQCGEQMEYLGNVLYEVNTCGHGVFCYGNYCASDNVFTPTIFYDRCGCYLNEKVKEK